MKIDYTKIPKAEATPEADSMIETFRAIGYTLETAVADIIDNSITAGAKNVWITRMVIIPASVSRMTDTA